MADNSLKIQLNIDVTKSMTNLATLEQKLVKVADLAKEINSGISLGGGASSMGADVNALNSQMSSLVESVRSAAEALNGNLSGIRTDFLDFTQGLADGLAESMQENSAALEEAEQAAQDFAEGFVEGMNEAREAEEKLNDETKNTARTTKSYLSTVSSSATRSAGIISHFGKKFLSIFSAISLFAILKKVFNSFVNQCREGLKNLVQYSGDYNKAMSELASAQAELKNQLAAAVEPLLLKLIPLFTQLTNYATMAADAISRFIAVISGKSTYTRAVKQNIDYANSLKAAAGALANFDELNVLGNGNGSGELTGANAFEEVEIDSATLAKIKELMALIEKFKTVAEYLQDKFKNGFLNAGDFDFSGLLGEFTRIRDTINELANYNGLGERVFGDVASISEDLGTMAGALEKVLKNVLELGAGGVANFLGENGEKGIENGLELLDCITKITDASAEASEAIATITEALTTEDAKKVLGDILVIVDDINSTVTLLLAKFSADVITNSLKTITENAEALRDALANTFSWLSGVTGVVKSAVAELTTSLQGFYDEHLSPTIDEIGTLISDLMDKYIIPLYNFLVTEILPVLTPMLETLLNVVVIALEGILNSLSFFVDLIRGIVEIVDGIVTGDWEKIWSGFATIVSGVIELMSGIVEGWIDLFENGIKGMMSFVAGVIRAGLAVIRGVFTTGLNGISDGAKGFKDGFVKGLKSFLETVSTTWTDKIGYLKDKALGVFDSLKESAKDMANAVIDSFEKMINGAIKALNAVIEPLAGKSFKIGSFTIDIPSSGLSEITLPRLANGGVTVGSTIANIGEAGREAVIPLERDTGWADVLAEKLTEKLGGNEYTFIAKIDSKVLFDETVQQSRMFTRRTGRNAFS